MALSDLLLPVQSKLPQNFATRTVVQWRDAPAAFSASSGAAAAQAAAMCIAAATAPPGSRPAAKGHFARSGMMFWLHSETPARPVFCVVLSQAERPANQGRGMLPLEGGDREGASDEHEHSRV